MGRVWGAARGDDGGPEVTRRRLLTAATLSGASLVAGCSGEGADGTRTGVPSRSEAVRTGTPGEADRRPVRLAAHEFVPVGETRELGNIGEILEVIDFGARLELSADGRRFTPRESGVSCLRARYRSDPSQNEVQTKCVIAIADTGPCSAREPASFDLQRYTDRPGDSNLLASGDGRFYRVCEGEAGLRLDRADRDLPPLYLQIVDATADGPYAIGSDEYDQQRRGTIHTYSGGELTPPWIVFLGGTAAGDGTITPDGRVDLELADCAGGPECSDDPAFVRAGDIVEMTQAGIGDLTTFVDTHGAAETTARLNALLDRQGVTEFEWEEVDERLEPYVTNDHERRIFELDFKGALFERLVRLQTFVRTVEHFDAIHALREKGVVITLFDDLLNRPLKCPSPSEEARAVCDDLEAALASAELRALESLGRDFEVWAHVSYWNEPGDHRPRIEGFDGAVVRAGFSGQAPVAEELRTIPARVRAWLRRLAEVDPNGIVLVGDSPVDLSWGPGELCEAEFCASDFGDAYRLNEALLEAFLEEVPELAAGFGVPMFEGSHFDIREPVSDRSGLELNRVGETGYNNPTLNIWATQ